SGLCLLVLGSMVCYWWYQRREHSQDGPILAAARHYGVEPALVKAVVWRESRFNPNRRGSAGEVGLMQLLPATFGEWAGAEKLPATPWKFQDDPATNTFAGTWYLQKLLKRYAQTDNPLPYALADYNAGRSHVLKWQQGAATTNSQSFIAQISFPGTRSYVRSVMRREEHYRRIFPGSDRIR
ncbi:MAG TPA: lytic transglycosylase domain-containing protein, partial [Verrucomicrobiae bacterium]|nr:lytic transglycosylase domain-containing protein [Verrucomicrobiae bacterium]